MIAADEFIEHCVVHTNLYGTAKAQIKKIQDAKKIPLLDIDVQGALKFHKAFPDSNYIGIVPPSIESLKQRLALRGTETEQTMTTRLGNAPGELKLIVETKDIFKYIIVNEDIEVSQSTFAKLVHCLY